jgi:putative endonuclease
LSPAHYARNEKQPAQTACTVMFLWLRNILPWKRTLNSGARGEQQAADWLEKERGFKVISRNWRNPRDLRDEIDLVCRDREVLVFVEVKARSAGALVPGFFAVDKRKKRVMRRVIDAYLRRLASAPKTFRFDVVEIVIHPGALAPDVLHFENVELFPKHYRG